MIFREKLKTFRYPCKECIVLPMCTKPCHILFKYTRQTRIIISLITTILITSNIGGMVALLMIPNIVISLSLFLVIYIIGVFLTFKIRESNYLVDTASEMFVGGFVIYGTILSELIITSTFKKYPAKLTKGIFQ